MAVDALTLRAMEGTIEQMPGASKTKAPKMVEDRLPMWEIEREIAPGATGAQDQDIEHCIKDAAQGVQEIGRAHV